MDENVSEGMNAEKAICWIWIANGVLALLAVAYYLAGEWEGLLP